MLSSGEVIKYVSANINRLNYSSMFIAGSLPEKLIPTSDLDIFFVIKGWKKDNFFENLTEVMDGYIKKHKEVTYTLFRGPIKYKHKGLIHFIVYTEERKHDFSDREQFIGESRPVLKTLLKNGKVVRGKSLESLLLGINWSDVNTIENDIANMKRKYSILQKENKINYKQWKRTPNGWKYLKTTKHVSKFLKEYLTHYFKKNISKAEIG